MSNIHKILVNIVIALFEAYPEQDQASSKMIYYTTCPFTQKIKPENVHYHVSQTANALAPKTWRKCQTCPPVFSSMRNELKNVSCHVMGPGLRVSVCLGLKLQVERSCPYFAFLPRRESAQSLIMKTILNLWNENFTSRGNNIVFNAQNCRLNHLFSTNNSSN